MWLVTENILQDSSKTDCKCALQSGELEVYLGKERVRISRTPERLSLLVGWREQKEHFVFTNCTNRYKSSALEFSSKLIKTKIS